LRKVLFFILTLFISSSPLNAAEEKVKIAAIIFDFGGVLVKGDKTVLREYIGNLFQIEGEELDQLLEEYRLARKRGVPEHLFFQERAEKQGIAIPEHFEAQLEHVKISSMAPVPGMRQLISDYQAKGIRVGLLSNAGVDSANWLRSNGFYEGLSPVLISCEIGADKPDPKAYQILLSELKLSPEQCIFIDDKEENVQAAKKLGIESIQFESYDQIAQELSKRVS
jgi:putative hydrolase of the HAD superfamily